MMDGLFAFRYVPMNSTTLLNLGAVCKNCAIIPGNVMSEIAKMIGIIPA